MSYVPYNDRKNRNVGSSELPNIASSLPTEQTDDPLFLLKHEYHKHTRPRLPGPSVLEDGGFEKDLKRNYRLTNREESKPNSAEEPVEVTEQENEPAPIEEVKPESIKVPPFKPKQSAQKKNIQPKLKKRNIVSRPPKESTSPKETAITNAAKSAQCDLLPKSEEKITVVPKAMGSVLKCLSFLLQELLEDTNIVEAEEIEKKLAEIRRKETADNFHFRLDPLYTSNKRIEKFAEDLSAYVLQNYNSKTDGKLLKIQKKKKLDIELHEKTYERKLLNEKQRREQLRLKTKEIERVGGKSIEIELQNCTLENEQLLAELRFNEMEFKKMHTKLAELDYELETNENKIKEVKKELLQQKKLHK